MRKITLNNIGQKILVATIPKNLKSLCLRMAWGIFWALKIGSNIWVKFRVFKFFLTPSIATILWCRKFLVSLKKLPTIDLVGFQKCLYTYYIFMYRMQYHLKIVCCVLKLSYLCILLLQTKFLGEILSLTFTSNLLIHNLKLLIILHMLKKALRIYFCSDYYLTHEKWSQKLLLSQKWLTHWWISACRNMAARRRLDLDTALLRRGVSGVH